MSSVDNKLEDFLVTKLGIPQESIDDGKEIAAWASAAGSIVGFVIAAYTLFNKLFGSGKPDPLRQKLDEISAAMATDKLSEIVNDLMNRALAIDTAGVALLSYINSPSAITWQKLYDNVTDPEGLDFKLGSLLGAKYFRFIPKAYAYKDPNDPKSPAKIPAWVNGRFVWGQFYHYFTTYSFSGEGQGSALTSSPFQVYKQKDKPLLYEFFKPVPLWQSENRWDGRLCLPLIVRGIAVWQIALGRLEPFYQLSGHWVPNIEGLSQKMLMDFAKKWSEQVLWTREMPSASELAAAGLFLVPLSTEQPMAGFTSWPCGILDPIMGVEIINPGWWKSGGELFTDDQRSKFKEQRVLLHLKLDAENGFAMFMKLTSGVSKLRIPPAISPSLKVHPNLLQVGHPGSGPQVIAPVPPPHFEPVTDPYGNAWTAQVHRSSVIATAPISVQPNPWPSAPPGNPQPPRRAVSDVVFGYEISVFPTGGTKQTSKYFQWPLRLSSPSPSLYHNSDNVGSNRKVPYEVTQNFSDEATTWKTVTDGYFRGKADEAKGGTVKFSVTVTVADQEPPRIPGNESNPHGLSWGAIWVRIDADKEDNHGRSFEVVVEVTETAAVDAMGQREYTDLTSGKKNPKFSGQLKKYTLKMPMPIDICTATVPTIYFFWLQQHLHILRADAHRLGIPGPHPDPDPSLELSIWRIVLERNPALLQVHVHSFRQLTGRPGLTAEQVLAQISAAAAKLASQSDVFVTPGMDAAIERDISVG